MYTIPPLIEWPGYFAPFPNAQTIYISGDYDNNDPILRRTMQESLTTYSVDTYVHAVPEVGETKQERMEIVNFTEVKDLPEDWEFRQMLHVLFEDDQLFEDDSLSENDPAETTQDERDRLLKNSILEFSKIPSIIFDGFSVDLSWNLDLLIDTIFDLQRQGTPINLSYLSVNASSAAIFDLIEDNAETLKTLEIIHLPPEHEKNMDVLDIMERIPWIRLINLQDFILTCNRKTGYICTEDPENPSIQTERLSISPSIPNKGVKEVQINLTYPAYTVITVNQTEGEKDVMRQLARYLIPFIDPFDFPDIQGFHQIGDTRATFTQELKDALDEEIEKYVGKFQN